MDRFDHLLNWTLKQGSHPFPGQDGGTCINRGGAGRRWLRLQADSIRRGHAGVFLAADLPLRDVFERHSQR